VPDVSWGDTWICLVIEVGRIYCRTCGNLKTERFNFLAGNRR
jgi:hypothetical protein